MPWRRGGQRIQKTFGTEERSSDGLFLKTASLLVLQAALHNRYNKRWFKWDTFPRCGEVQPHSELPTHP